MSWRSVLAASVATGCTLATASDQTEVASQGAFPANSGRPARGAFIVDFAKGHDEEAHLLTDWDIDASWLGVSYRARNIAYGQHGLSLVSRREASRVSTHSSAEFQYVGAYGYGRYEAVLRASDAPGVVTAFFVYTGADRGEPHDEIDVEILGRDPRSLHTNFFRNGKGSPIDIALGFNAAKGDHLYAFEWLPDSITWSVDGVPIRRVTADEAPIPTTTGRVMASLWAANRSSVEWVGTPTFETATANVRCISHVPAGGTGRQCSDTFVPSAGP